MATIKLSLSLEEETARMMRQRAMELRKSLSGYLSDLVRGEVQQHQDELAAEGYRILSQDTGSFAAAAMPVAAETWPEWQAVEEESSDEPKAQER